MFSASCCSQPHGHMRYAHLGLPSLRNTATTRGDLAAACASTREENSEMRYRRHEVGVSNTPNDPLSRERPQSACKRFHMTNYCRPLEYESHE